MFDYNEWTEASKRWIVKQALHEVEKSGLSLGRHFYISFASTYPGVEAPKELIDENPKEISILIQDAFWSLTINDDNFSIEILINNTKRYFVIPFKALTSFVDPLGEFGLQITPTNRSMQNDCHNVISFEKFKKNKK